MEIESIPTTNYSEVIQVNVPIRFYFLNGFFDGIAASFTKELMPWQKEMFERCLSAVNTGIGNEEGTSPKG